MYDRASARLARDCVIPRLVGATRDAFANISGALPRARSVYLKNIPGTQRSKQRDQRASIARCCCSILDTIINMLGMSDYITYTRSFISASKLSAALSLSPEKERERGVKGGAAAEKSGVPRVLRDTRERSSGAREASAFH